MIFEILEKSKGLENSEIKRKLTNSKNYVTAYKNYKEDKLDANCNELYYINRRNSHSVSLQKKLKINKNKNFIKLFYKKKTKKSKNNKLKKETFENKDDNQSKAIKSNSKKNLLQNNSRDFDENNSTFSGSNEIKKSIRKTSNFSSTSFSGNFVLKSEICNNFINKDNKDILKEEK